MSRLRSWVIAGVAVAQAGAAMAADLPSSSPTYFAPPRLMNLDGGWYVRGDLGYAWGAVTGTRPARGFPGTHDDSLGSGFVGGLGVGIKSQWLRTDVTLDYTGPLKYQGTIAAANDTSAKVSAVTALFNGYLDLGSWYRATPYIGAGAGAAQLRTTDYSSSGAPPFAPGLSNTQWKLAFAAMAGFGYVVAPNAVVDIGYRYVNFGDASTASDFFGSMTLRNLAAHEVRVGFRWSFDDLSMAQ